MRGVAAVFAVAENPTVPGPVPDAPDVTVSHAAFETADHVQPVPAETETVPLEAPAPSVVEVADNDGAHGAETVNVFERVLGVVPPGPTADTRAW